MARLGISLACDAVLSALSRLSGHTTSGARLLLITNYQRLLFKSQASAKRALLNAAHRLISLSPFLDSFPLPHQSPATTQAEFNAISSRSSRGQTLSFLL